MPLAAQSRDEPVPYSLPARTTSGVPCCLIGHRRVVDRQRRAVGAAGHAALDAGEHLVADADVGEGAAHHHLVIAAARAIAVIFGARDLVLAEVGAGRAVGLDRAGGRDVVGGDRIAEHRQRLAPTTSVSGLGVIVMPVK